MSIPVYHDYQSFSISSPEDGAYHMALHGRRVFPLAPKTKVPFADFTRYAERATTDLQQIHVWTLEYPGCNFASPNEQHDFQVDIDLKHNGPVNWRNFQAQHGDLPVAPLVWSGSGSGAAHLYFRAPSNSTLPYIMNFSRGPLAGIQILGPRHYIVCPGSIHPTTSQKYYWDATRNLDTLEIPEAPHWFIKLLQSEHTRQPKAQTSPRSSTEKSTRAVVARRLSPDNTPEFLSFSQGNQARESRATQVIQSGEEKKLNTCVESRNRGAYAGKLFTRFHQEPATRDPLQEALGLPVGTADGTKISCPVHPDDAYGARWHEPHDEHGQRGVYCFADGMFYSALDLLYRQRCPKGLLTAGHTAPIPKPSLCVVTALLLMEMGLLSVEARETDALPPDLPNDARQLAETLILVQRARSATREAEAPMPIGPKFFCDWLHWTDYRFDRARQTLQSLAPDFLQRAEADHETHISKQNPRYRLWTLATRAARALSLAGQYMLEKLAKKFALVRPYPIDSWGDPECVGCGLYPEQEAWIPVASGWQCPDCWHIDERDGPPQRRDPGGGAACATA